MKHMKRRYYEDIELFSSGWSILWTILFLTFLFTLPLYITSYYFLTFNLILVYIIAALGLNLLVGYTGQISLGHAGFFAIGAYGTTFLMSYFGVPFFIAIVLAGFIAAFLGFIIGLPALRLEGPYLAIATLGFGLAIMHVIGRVEIFGGRIGMHTPPLDIGIPQLNISYVINSDIGMYFLILIVTIFMVIFIRNLTKTKVGRAFIAIRDDDIAAEVMGVNLAVYKTLAFAISAFCAAIAGGFYGFILGFFDPFTFNLIFSIILLAIVVVGGLGSILGSVMGACLVIYLQHSLLHNVGELPYAGSFFIWISKTCFTVIGMQNISGLVLGLIMIGIIIFEPLGMYGIWIRIKNYWKTWPF